MKIANLKKIALNTTYTTSSLIGLMALNIGYAVAGEAPKLEISGKVTVVHDLRAHKSPNYIKNLDIGSGVDGKSDNMPTGADIYLPDYLNNLVFKGKGKTDSGLEYGAKYEILLGTEPSSIRTFENGVRTDEASLYFSGDWGRVELGQEDPWTSGNFYAGGKILAGVGHWAGALDSTRIYTDLSYTLITQGYGNDDAKVTYSSPTFNGFSFGASYLPSAINPFREPGTLLTTLYGQNTVRPNNGLNSAVIAGAKYERAINNITIGLSFGATHGKAQNAQVQDMRAYSMGAQIGNEEIKVAGSYSNHGRGFMARDPKSYLLYARGQTIDGGVAPTNIYLSDTLGAGYPTSLPKVMDLGVSYNFNPYTKVSFGYLRSVTPTQKGAFITPDKYAAQFTANSAAALNAANGGALSGLTITQAKAALTAANNPSAVAFLTSLENGGIPSATTIAQAAGATAAANNAIVPDQVSKNITETGYHIGFFTPLAQGLGIFAEGAYNRVDNGKNNRNIYSNQQILVGTLIWF